MKKLIIEFSDRNKKGFCEMLEKMDCASYSFYRQGTRKKHYYLYEVDRALKGLDFKDPNNEERRVLIRRPGRSCGWAQIDKDNIIVKNNFYEEIGQDKEMIDIMDKFIGFIIELEVI